MMEFFRLQQQQQQQNSQFLQHQQQQAQQQNQAQQMQGQPHPQMMPMNHNPSLAQLQGQPPPGFTAEQQLQLLRARQANPALLNNAAMRARMGANQSSDPNISRQLRLLENRVGVQPVPGAPEGGPSLQQMQQQASGQPQQPVQQQAQQSSLPRQPTPSQPQHAQPQQPLSQQQQQQLLSSQMAQSLSNQTANLNQMNMAYAMQNGQAMNGGGPAPPPLAIPRNAADCIQRITQLRGVIQQKEHHLHNLSNTRVDADNMSTISALRADLQKNKQWLSLLESMLQRNQWPGGQERPSDGSNGEGTNGNPPPGGAAGNVPGQTNGLTPWANAAGAGQAGFPGAGMNNNAASLQQYNAMLRRTSPMQRPQGIPTLQNRPQPGQFPPAASQPQQPPFPNGAIPKQMYPGMQQQQQQPQPQPPQTPLQHVQGNLGQHFQGQPQDLSLQAGPSNLNQAEMLLRQSQAQQGQPPQPQLQFQGNRPLPSLDLGKFEGFFGEYLKRQKLDEANFPREVTIEGNTLHLHDIHKAVMQFGGGQNVSARNGWAHVAQSMNIQVNGVSMETVGQRLREIHGRLLGNFENTYLSVLARNQQQHNAINAAHLASMNRALTPSGGAPNIPGRPGMPAQPQPQPQPQVNGQNGHPGYPGPPNPQNPQNPQLPPGAAATLQQMQFKQMMMQANMTNEQLRSQGHSQASIEAIERKRDFLNRQVLLNNGTLQHGQPHPLPPQGQVPLPNNQQPPSGMVPSHHPAQHQQPSDPSASSQSHSDFVAQAQQALNAQRARLGTPQPRPNSGINVHNQPTLQPPPMGRPGIPQPGPGAPLPQMQRPTDMDVNRAMEWIQNLKMGARNMNVPQAQVTEAERPEWNRLFETASKMLPEMDRQLSMYLCFFKRPDEVKHVLSFLHMLSRQREEIARTGMRSPHVDYISLDFLKRIMNAFATVMSRVRSALDATRGDAPGPQPPQPSQPHAQLPPGPPPVPVQNMNNRTITPDPPRPPTQPPPTPQQNPVISKVGRANKASSSPSPAALAASTPAPSANTPNPSSNSPRTPKSPGKKPAAKAKPAAKRKVTAPVVAPSPPKPAAPEPVTGSKRPRPEETETKPATAPTPSAGPAAASTPATAPAATSSLPPPKRPKLSGDWEIAQPGTDVEPKVEEQDLALSSMSLIEDMTKLLESSQDIFPELQGTLDSLANSFFALPQASKDGSSGSGEGSSANGIKTESGLGAGDFFEFFDFSQCEDDTPELVANVSTGPSDFSPESGPDEPRLGTTDGSAAQSAPKSATADPALSKASSNFDQTSPVWGHIGADPYFLHNDNWKSDGPMTEAEQPWAISTF
ncbi:hypothetical protein SISNIDRAFT_466773 [Sistotremastrum niveocremeum HHB9708]|uniref:ARID domain-containing protein n=1 Tax=Sistotremastrum niveocremeum HHB9708 TaxID=1314777 RepID=A0A164THN1_9AGAM|nr:hypothetical protein SISNIDRAFT_466773 [Sistotremastrum niveocremeum HHB9708]